MITGFNDKNKKDDARALTFIIIGFFFVVWLCTPPGNKFAQLCFYGNNTQFLIAKLTKPTYELDEWKFHRNNAIYLAKMERKQESLLEIDRAIKTLPSFASEQEENGLYLDRAELRLYFEEHKLALDDYLRVKSPSLLENFKIGVLYKKIGNNKYALSYCNNVLDKDPTAYIGYACIADIYAGVGRYDTSIRVYDLLIARTPNRARYYVDRAGYKKLYGDVSGYNADLAKAKDLSPMIDLNSSIINETLKPKKILLSVI